MKVVIFGLTVSSSWGNGHATLWRALCAALARRGHHVVFFERDVPYYAANRDLTSLFHAELILYQSFSDIANKARQHVADADLALVTSYCPDGRRASQLVLDSNAAVRGFYDLDTPVTLERLRNGSAVDYLPLQGLGDFDLVLSYTGGSSLTGLRTLLGARRVAPLYGSVDPAVHQPTPPVSEYRSHLSYLGTYAADRQAALETLFLEPARRLPQQRFLIGGAQYPQDFPWLPNVHFVQHMPPGLHPAFFSSSRATLNITRMAMAECGYCPSGRLFEAAACGVPILSDAWEGLDQFFTPGKEIAVVQTPEQVLETLQRSDAELQRMASAARERTLAQHTADNRVMELERLVGQCKEDLAAAHSPLPANVKTDPQEVWGIIPAAGVGSRIQPLAFSKELLPVGSRIDGETERPRAVSEYIIERMIAGGATKICFVISPGKSDILEYYAAGISGVDMAYVVQPNPGGLCDAIFRALPVIPRDAHVLIGLPDTIWFPETGLAELPDNHLSFLLFPVEHPELFDAVVTDDAGNVQAVDVKLRQVRSHWVWGALKMPASVLRELHALWRQPERGDEYIGTLVNAYLAGGGLAIGVRAGHTYVDVGTLHGYREATRLLNSIACGEEQQPLAAADSEELNRSTESVGDSTHADIRIA